MKKIVKFLCFFILVSFATYGNETLTEIKQQLDRMNREITDLQKEIYTNNKDFSTENNNLIDISEVIQTIYTNYQLP